MKIFIPLVTAIALTGCTHLFFQPSGNIIADPASAGIVYEVVKFRSLDGTELTGMFFPPAGPPRATVVHFHGNAGNMTGHFPYSSWLAAEGFNVFVFDYRGYGASGGTPSLEGLVMDGIAALRQAARLPGAETDKMIVFGQSLGGAIAIASVSGSGTPPPAAMVLEGSFYSYRGVASAVLRGHWLSWPVSWLPWLTVSGRYSPSDLIAGLTCEKVFIHSEKDPSVPFAQGMKLYASARGPKELWRTPAGHIEAFGVYRGVYGPRLLEFLTKALSEK